MKHNQVHDFPSAIFFIHDPKSSRDAVVLRRCKVIKVDSSIYLELEREATTILFRQARPSKSTRAFFRDDSRHTTKQVKNFPFVAFGDLTSSILDLLIPRTICKKVSEYFNLKFHFLLYLDSTICIAQTVVKTGSLLIKSSLGFFFCLT